VGTGTDPWLSTTEPTWLDFGPVHDASETTPENYPGRRVDLGNISNLAPDGAFVNLFNLRDEQAGFNATPWEMRGDSRNLTGPNQAYELTLFDPDNSVVNRGTVPDFMVAIPGNELSSQAETRPFYWTSRQVGAHRPVGDPSRGHGDNDYTPYQWADADGDKAYEARWFELVIDRDPSDDTWNDIFTRQGDLRYFIAATVRDLSALVNVNTATDGTLDPDLVEPSGITPAQIDLRRMLTLVDQTRDLGTMQSVGEGYTGLTDGTTDNYGLYTEAEAFQIGDRAYDALRFALSEGVMPDVLSRGPDNPGYDGLVSAAGDDPNEVNREFFFDGFYGSNGTGRTDFYNTIANLDPLAGAVWDADLGGGHYRTSPLFGLDSLEELLTFRRINDPRRTSRLELAMHGRGNYPAGDDLAGFGPLRSDRMNESASFFAATPVGDIAGRTSQFLAHSIMDVRGRLTTLSGHRPIFGADLPTPTELFTAADDVARNNLTQLAPVDMRTPLVVRPQGTMPPDRGLLVETDELFRLYADALLPWSDMTDAWTDDQLATLAYAGNTTQVFGPELALRIAAHMAVNMTDIADDDHEPTRRSLLVDFSRRSDFVNASDGNGVATDVEPALPYTLLELPEARLATTDTDLVDGPAGYGRAINVFGIEAQPFITMAGTMVVYSDVPTAFGGPVTESAGPPPVPPTGPSNTLVPNLDTTFNVANPDFLFEALAVELTNPFDEPIELAEDEFSGGPGAPGGFTYYLQFGDLYFRLTDHNHTSPATALRRGFTLAPGESRTVFCMSLTPTQVLARLNAASGGAIAPANLSAWIEAQFGADAVLMWPMGSGGGTTVTADLVNGAPLPTGDIGSLAGGMIGILSEATDLPDRDVVRLWYAVRPETIAGNPTVNTPTTETDLINDPDTDVLIDRLRVPTAGLLTDVRNTGGEQDITGATAAPDNMGDNTGLTITQWAMIRRSDDPDAASFASSDYRGTLPAWAFEPVDNGGDIPRPSEQDPIADNAAAFAIGDFTTMGNHGGTTLGDWYTTTLSALPSDTILPLIVDNPADRSTDLVANINAGARIEHRLTSGTASTISVARLADLLLPMGIGPMHDPGPDLTITTDDRWLTLSEAIAIASNLEDAAAATPFADLDGFYKGLGDSALFFGQLVVDDFVPFYDMDMDGAYMLGTDVPRGLRITPAMRIVQSAVGFTNEQASLIRPAFGTLNINTASLETLRSLPMLSPPVGIDDALAAAFNTAYSSNQMWWWDNVVPFSPGARRGEQTIDSDIAATLVGYRDRRRLITRSTDVSPLPVNASTLDFLNAGVFADDGPPGYDTMDTGRGTAINLIGTTELPGIRSIGELLAIRDFNAPPEHSIDSLIEEDGDIIVPGVAGTLYDDGSGVLVGDGILAGGGTTAAIDYDQQFAIANSVFNTISIGSDYYAVWFLIHGYSEEDTKVDPTDPLVPTVARRFLMVMDRSGVIRRGDAPKIVLFREVPVALP